jgi:hypothetical protein
MDLKMNLVDLLVLIRNKGGLLLGIQNANPQVLIISVFSTN